MAAGKFKGISISLEFAKRKDKQMMKNLLIENYQAAAAFPPHPI